MIDICIEEMGKAVIINVTGELSLSDIEEFKKIEIAITGYINSNFAAVAMDLKNVPYIDSFGISRIIRTLRAFSNSGTEFILVGINDNIRQVFKDTTFGSIFNIMTREKFIEEYCKTKSGYSD